MTENKPERVQEDVGFELDTLSSSLAVNAYRTATGKLLKPLCLWSLG